jgi:hypothetical protein
VSIESTPFKTSPVDALPPNIGLQRTSACGLAAEAGSVGGQTANELP